MCGYRGKFRYSGLYEIRPDALCKSCWSTDRERLYAQFLQQRRFKQDGLNILHFAPEPAIEKILRPGSHKYVTADLYSDSVDFNWNIEDLKVDDNSFDLVVCFHVLEHVDTEMALREIRRVLRPRGEAHLMVPIYEGLEKTYVNATANSNFDRHLHFHQADHIRLIGRDFRQQIKDAGFDLDEFAASGQDAARFGLRVGERVFIAKVVD
jgi:SAM-dependent methyltransferase